MKKGFPVKRLRDGKAMLNLACGNRNNWEWNNLDFSPYARLAHHPAFARTLKSIGFLSPKRYGRLMATDPEIIFFDLRNGIPFDDDTFDVVYHSHFLEHLDRGSALFIMEECYRVLKLGAVTRVVVPDLQILVERYTSTLSALEAGHEPTLGNHLESIHNLFEQMVREAPVGVSQQRPLVRFIESYLRGDAAKTGELHRWMYDKYSLRALLSDTGFRDIRVEAPSTSRIQDWGQFHLDTDSDGTIYKPGSLYMEGVKHAR